jgi:hypothetical protein
VSAKRRKVDPSETLSYAMVGNNTPWVRGLEKGQTTLQFRGEVPGCAVGLWPLESAKMGAGAGEAKKRR